MPEICRFFGIVITINYRELPHQRPHFHARYAGSRASIAIDTLEVLAGSLSPRSLSLVLEWAREHQAELTANWALASRGERPNKIQPLE